MKFINKSKQIQNEILLGWQWGGRGWSAVHRNEPIHASHGNEISIGNYPCKVGIWSSQYKTTCIARLWQNEYLGDQYRNYHHNHNHLHIFQYIMYDQATAIADIFVIKTNMSVDHILWFSEGLVHLLGPG